MMVYPINDDVLISGYLQTTGNIYNNAYYNVLDNDGSTWINALLIANSSPNTDFHFVPNYVTQNGGTSRVFFGYASNWDSYNWMSGLDVNGNPIRLMTIDPSGVKVPSSRSVVPYSELEPCLWGLQYNSGSGQWDWTADSHELTIGNSIRFEDTVANKFLDLAAIRTDMNPEDATLWISRHLIVKKDFAVGGAATVFQGALVLGSDWDAHNPNAQMPQIMLAHSEGGSYPENPKRDILQIWRNGHLGFAHLQCGSIYVEMDYPTLDLKAADGQLKVTLKFDGVNGLLYTSEGDLVLAGNTNQVRPLSDNAYLLGDSSFRWKEIWAASTHFGDAVFANGWRLTEDSDNSGVLLLRPDGSVAQRWA